MLRFPPFGASHRARPLGDSLAGPNQRPGPTVVGGALFVASGYSYLGLGMAGNVLVAFRPE
jgi:hypothetical protein